MNKIDSRTDWLLDSCFYNCFVCGSPFTSPPKLDKGKLEGNCLFFNIRDEWGDKVETEERVCHKCWISDLSRFADKEELD